MFNKKKAEMKLKISDTSFLTGQENCFNGRLRTGDMAKLAPLMDEAGFYSVEIAGGPSFETMMKRLNENPWDRIRTLKRYFKKTLCAMRISARHLTGKTACDKDLIKEFIGCAAENGIDMFRIYDPVNDMKTMKNVMGMVSELGKKIQGGIVCHAVNTENLEVNIIQKAIELEKAGADSICLMDVEGVLSPFQAAKIITALKEKTSLSLFLSLMSNKGMGPMTAIKAVEAGVDGIDTCMGMMPSPTPPPTWESLTMALKNTPRDPKLNMEPLVTAGRLFTSDILPKYTSIAPVCRPMSAPDALFHNIPDHIVNLASKQLREVDKSDKADKAFSLIRKVAADLGNIPLVFPLDGMIVTQAINNMIFDKGTDKYSMVTDAIVRHCLTLNGETSSPVATDLMKQIPEAQMNEDKIKTKRSLVKADDLAVETEDRLLISLFPESGLSHIEWKSGRKTPPADLTPKTIEEALAESERLEKAKAGLLVEKLSGDSIPAIGAYARKFNVLVEDEYFEVTVDEIGGPPMIQAIAPVQMAAPAAPVQAAPIQVAPVQPDPAPATPDPAPATPAPAPATPDPAPVQTPATAVPAAAPAAPAPASAGGTEIKAPMPGVIIRYTKQPGDPVKAGEVVVLLEAMKMENALRARADGTMGAIIAAPGATVATNDVLCTIQG